jgi:FlaA1/EpsC-like NDP-sugar epimerase
MTSVVAIATGREHSLFAADVAANAQRLGEAFTGARLLVVGGAGTIGSATLRAVLPYDPAAIHVVDQNENGLAELVRDVRNTGLARPSLDFRLLPLDYGAPVTRRFLSSSGPYNAVLHFAALKHVRSEKDVASILQMVDTNVLKQHRLLEWLAEERHPSRYFAVSTDKAANPANFMGATKRLMEHLLFTDASNPLKSAVRTSARFANVAFSAGSLLASFGDRIRLRQPIAAPLDTRRFFVSIEEAAEICLLASAVMPSGHLAIPRMRPGQDLRELVPIAEAFLTKAGFRPIRYDDEVQARDAVDRDTAIGGWPLLCTPRDTDGEKESEEFVGEGENPKEIGLSAVLGIPQQGVDPSSLESTLGQLREWTENPTATVTKADLARVFTKLISEFRPIQHGRTLDERM